MIGRDGIVSLIASHARLSALSAILLLLGVSALLHFVFAWRWVWALAPLWIGGLLLVVAIIAFLWLLSLTDIG